MQMPSLLAGGQGRPEVGGVVLTKRKQDVLGRFDLGWFRFAQAHVDKFARFNVAVLEQGFSGPEEGLIDHGGFCQREINRIVVDFAFDTFGPLVAELVRDVVGQGQHGVGAVAPFHWHHAALESDIVVMFLGHGFGYPKQSAAICV